jgi:hypothetical protein
MISAAIIVNRIHKNELSMVILEKSTGQNKGQSATVKDSCLSWMIMVSSDAQKIETIISDVNCRGMVFSIFLISLLKMVI